jgi:hypothetical protein
VPGSFFFGFLAFVLGKKKEESEKPKREEEQQRRYKYLIHTRFNQCFEEVLRKFFKTLI